MILGRDFFGEIIVAQKKHRLATLYPSQDTMRTDFYSIVLTSTLVLVVNCFNLDRELQNFDQSLLETKSNERSSKCKPPEFLLSRKNYSSGNIKKVDLIPRPQCSLYSQF